MDDVNKKVSYTGIEVDLSGESGTPFDDYLKEKDAEKISIEEENERMKMEIQSLHEDLNDKDQLENDNERMNNEIESLEKRLGVTEEMMNEQVKYIKILKKKNEMLERRLMVQADDKGYDVEMKGFVL